MLSRTSNGSNGQPSDYHGVFPLIVPHGSLGVHQRPEAADGAGPSVVADEVSIAVVAFTTANPMASGEAE